MKQTAILALALSTLLGACQYKSVNAPALSQRDAEYIALVPKFEHHLTHLPYEIADPTGQPPGTIVVDTKAHYLYFVKPGGKAIRYGVGLGKDGFAWSGRGVIQRKVKWPHWTPSDEMVDRQPALKTVSAERGGLVAGLNNPLGARALYIYQNGKDTLYRVHGTPDWQSVGKATSSGCVRMFNQDVIDLFDRVPDRTPIVVI